MCDLKPDITTDVLIIGTGPAGSAASALLSTYCIETMVINRDLWLVRTRRAHIPNQRRMKVLQNLGRGLQDDVYVRHQPRLDG